MHNSFKIYSTLSVFFIYLQTSQCNTGFHVAFFGPQEIADRYYCSVKIENRAQVGAEGATCRLKIFGASTWNNMLQTNGVYGYILGNEVLKSYCDPSNDNLYFS